MCHRNGGRVYSSSSLFCLPDESNSSNGVFPQALNFLHPFYASMTFLPPKNSQRVLQECIDLKKVYMPAKVFDGPTATKIDLNYRKNEVVYLNDVFNNRSRSLKHLNNYEE